MLQTVQGGGLDIEEPDWSLLIPNQGGTTAGSNKRWRDYAHQEWLRITSEMRETNTLAPVNRHTIQRLVLAYIRYDRAAIEVFRGGTIGKAPTSQTATLQIYHSEMRQADADATTAERELGLTPLRRGNTKQVKRAEKIQRKSDRYLQQSVSS
jgi:phage terminase small subunit